MRGFIKPSTDIRKIVVILSFVLVIVSKAKLFNGSYFRISNKCHAVPSISVSLVNCVIKKGASDSSPSEKPGLSYVIHNDGAQLQEKVLVPPGCKTIEISCRASQPITWTYDGLKRQKLPDVINDVKSQRTTSGPWNDNGTYCSEMIITVRMRPDSTGRYICALPTSHNVSTTTQEINFNEKPLRNTKSTLYLWNDNGTAGLWERSLDNLDASGPISFSIPCNKPKGPNMTAELVKLDLHSQTFKAIPGDFNFTYDEQTGVVNAISLSAKDIPGTYKCAIGSLQESEYVVNTNFDVKELSERSNDLEILRRNKSESHSASNYECVSCASKSGKAKITGMQILACKNLAHCDLLWEATRDYLKRLSSYNPGDDDYCSSKTRIEKSSGVSGVVLCSTQDGEQYQYAEYFVTDKKEVVWNPSTAVVSERALIMTHDIRKNRGYVCVSNVRMIACSAAQYLFSDGVQLAVRYKDGSIGSTEKMASAVTPRSHYDGYYNYEWNVTITSTNITNYICMAPLINSHQWMKIFAEKKELRIIDGTPPVILKNHSRTNPPLVKFRLSDTNVRLSCAAAGRPRPLIEWYKDGHDPFSLGYDSITKHNDQTTGDTIIISWLEIPSVRNIGADPWGKWSCKASNGLNPNATYEILVELTDENPEPPLAHILIAITVLTSICFIIGSCFACYRIRTNQWIKKKLREKNCHSFLNGDPQLVSDIMKSTVVCGWKISRAIRYPKICEIPNPEDIDKGENQVVLGEGNFAKVIKARYKTPSGETSDVAVKMPIVRDYHQAAMLLKEVKTLAFAGKHEHIIVMIGAVTKDIFNDHVEIVLEFCDTSLESFLRKHRAYYCNEITNDKLCFSLNSDQQSSSNESQKATKPTPGYVTVSFGGLEFRTFDLIRWAYQIACGMQYLTSRGLIHGDIAPRNMLIQGVDGDHRGNIKIADFGLTKRKAKKQYIYTKVLGENDSGAELPWRQLPPELMNENTLVFSESSDVWSYGITIWEMFSLCKVLPYSEFPEWGENFIRAVKYENYQNPKPEYANNQIYDIMRKCWNGPSERPKFTELTKDFLSLLPSDYVKTIPGKVYEPPTFNMTELEPLLPKRDEAIVQFEFDEKKGNNGFCCKYLHPPSRQWSLRRKMCSC